MKSFESMMRVDPVQVAEPFAYQLVNDDTFRYFSRSKKERQLVEDMNQMLYALDMPGGYDVTASNAYVLKKKDGGYSGEKTNIVQKCNTMWFKGDLIAGDTLKIGEIIGHGAVRATCLLFDEVEIRCRQAVFEDSDGIGSLDRVYVAEPEKIAEDEMMYVPVFAFKKIEAV